MAVQLDTREVLVERTNDHGFKSSDGDWLNVSRYANPSDVAMPRVGDRVTVSLDRSGFVRKIETAVPITTQAAPQLATVPIAGQTTQESPIAPTITQDAKGTVILRMNVMTTATAILSSGGGATTPEEVLELAARLEVWATR